MKKIFEVSWDFGHDPEWFNKERLQNLLNENYGEKYKVKELPTKLEFCECNLGEWETEENIIICQGCHRQRKPIKPKKEKDMGV